MISCSVILGGLTSLSLFILDSVFKLSSALMAMSLLDYQVLIFKKVWMQIYFSHVKKKTQSWISSTNKYNKMESIFY